MINRYEVPEISNLWTDHARFERMLQVELALLETLEENSVVPSGTRQAFNGVRIDVSRIQEIENTTKHDVIAFCTSITEQVPPESGRYFHYGVTSSDILDTALVLQVRDSLAILLSELKLAIQTLKARAIRYRSLMCLGRSHGIAAEPMVFGQKFLTCSTELERRLSDYERNITHCLYGQLSGAVGNYSILTPELESLALNRLGLLPAKVSTQVLPRDLIASIVATGALTAAAIDRFCIELRHLHRSEVQEVSEGFSVGQKGSSTMPHKKNPISSENLSGISRVIESHFGIAMNNISLWHERDISHSSAERLYLPDHFGLLVYALRRFNKLINDLNVDSTAVAKNLNSQFMVFSGLVLHELIKVNSVPREELYSLIQSAAFESKSSESFFSNIQSRVAARNLNLPSLSLSPESLKAYYVKQFEKVLVRSGVTIE